MKNSGDRAELIFRTGPLETKEEILAAWAFANMSDNGLPRFENDKRKEEIQSAAESLGLNLESEYVERSAKLFEAGEYPDKGMTVSEADLNAIAAATENNLPLPILLEHTRGPLSFGALGKVWLKGKELFGKLVFPKPAWDLIQSCGAGKLSIGLRRDGGGISEISLVTAPRVASAAIFSRTGADLQKELGTEAHTMPENIGENSFSSRIEELEDRVKRLAVEDTLKRLKTAGKVVPAAEEFARAILSMDRAQVVNFAGSESETSAAELFIKFLDAQPRAVEFSELASASANRISDYSEADKKFFSRLGVTAEQVASRNAR